MNNTQRELRCVDLVQDKFNEIEKTYNEVDDLYDYVNSTALSWGYVEAETFEGQDKGYYRLQLSWGGPSDEFRIYTIEDSLDIDYIEYHYMDWFDGASVPVLENTASFDVCYMFLEGEV